MVYSRKRRSYFGEIRLRSLQVECRIGSGWRDGLPTWNLEDGDKFGIAMALEADAAGDIDPFALFGVLETFLADHGHIESHGIGAAAADLEAHQAELMVILPVWSKLTFHRDPFAVPFTAAVGVA